MNPASFPTSEREIFLEAMDQEPGERAGFLSRACAGRAGLKERVEDLIRQSESMGDFLDQPALTPPASLPVGPGGTVVLNAGTVRVTEKPGDRIGPYKILQQIGEGGCGVVYLAEQERPVRRRVALKIIKLGMDTKNVIARFEAERQALAMMDHPNIARVFDAGATETGRPYFVMELVRGIKITEYCDQNNLPSTGRLELFMTVCQAIQHAHQKGVIHRDIKPSNILVTLHDGQPVPKVIDFGIAKATDQRLTDKTLFTEFQAFIGTPAYMSPEQAEMSGLDIDTRSDIYSLGVLLYQLLTGETPFDSETLLKDGIDQCRRTIREQEPPRPSIRLATLVDADLTTVARQRQTESARLIQSLRGDLDWVVMKCLEKDRTRRYATANELAIDVRRHLESEPVLARPPSNLYRLQKMFHRHRGAVAAGVAIALSLLAGISISTWLAVQARKSEKSATRHRQEEAHMRRQAESERQRAEIEQRSARLNEYVADMNLAHQSLLAGNFGRAFQLLEKHRPKPGAADFRGFEWRYLWKLCQGSEHLAFPEHDSAVHGVVYSPSGQWLATLTREKINLWRMPERTLHRTLMVSANAAAFLPNDRLLTVDRSEGRSWNPSDGTFTIVPPEGGGGMAVTSNGQWVATGGRDGFRIWNSADWSQVKSLPGVFGRPAFSPDGSKLIGETREGTFIWSTANWEKLVQLENLTNSSFFGQGLMLRGMGRSVQFSGDGKYVLAPQNTVSDRGDFPIRIWNASNGREIGSLPEKTESIEHTSTISALASSPDGRFLVSASFDHSLRLWDLSTRRRVTAFQGHMNEIFSVAFSPDGQRIISGAKDGSVKSWSLRPGPREDKIEGQWIPLGFSPDGGTVAAAGRDGAVQFFNLESPIAPPVFQLEGRRNSFGFGVGVTVSRDLRTLARVGAEGGIEIWDTERKESTLLATTERPDFLSLSAEGKKLLAGRRDRLLKIWDLRAGTNSTLETEAFRAFFSPDGSLAATLSGRAAGVEIWDVTRGLLRTNLSTEGLAPFAMIAFSPDGKKLAIGLMDNTVGIWEAASGARIGTLSGHKQPVFSLAFAPDHRTVVTSSDDSTVKFWSLETEQELMTIHRTGGAMGSLLFSADGRWLVGGGGAGFAGKGPGKLVLYSAPLFAEIDAVRRSN